MWSNQFLSGNGDELKMIVPKIDYFPNVDIAENKIWLDAPHGVQY